MVGDLEAETYGGSGGAEQCDFTRALVARWNACLDALDVLDEALPPGVSEESPLGRARAILRAAIHGEPEPAAEVAG